MAPTVSAQAGVLRRLLDATVAGDRGAMADLVTADVTGWSPTLFVTSRDEPLAALEHRDDAFSGTSARRALPPVEDSTLAPAISCGHRDSSRRGDAGAAIVAHGVHARDADGRSDTGALMASLTAGTSTPPGGSPF